MDELGGLHIVEVVPVTVFGVTANPTTGPWGFIRHPPSMHRRWGRCGFLDPLCGATTNWFRVLTRIPKGPRHTVAGQFRLSSEAIEKAEADSLTCLTGRGGARLTRRAPLKNRCHTIRAALEKERFAQARQLRSPSPDKDGRSRQWLQLRRQLGRWLIAFGRRLVADEADAI